MGMILRIASSRIVGQGDIVGRSGYFSLNLSANSVMRGRLDARRTLKSLVADLRIIVKTMKKVKKISVWRGKAILCLLVMILSTAGLSARLIKMQQGPDPVKFELAVSLVKQ